MDLKNEIYKLENLLLQPEIRKSPEKLKELLSDDFKEFGGSGMVLDRDKIIELLPLETDTEFKMSDFSVKKLSPDTVLATYKVAKIEAGKMSESLRSSIWKKTQENWQMVFHQGTITSK